MKLNSSPEESSLNSSSNPNETSQNSRGKPKKCPSRSQTRCRRVRHQLMSHPSTISQKFTHHLITIQLASQPVKISNPPYIGQLPVTLTPYLHSLSSFSLLSFSPLSLSPLSSLLIFLPLTSCPRPPGPSRETRPTSLARPS